MDFQLALSGIPWGAPTSSVFRTRPFEWSSIICYSATLVLFIHLHVGTRTGTIWHKSTPLRSIMINHDHAWSIMIHHEQSWSCLSNQSWSIMISHNKPCWSSFDVITAKRLWSSKHEEWGECRGIQQVHGDVQEGVPINREERMWEVVERDEAIGGSRVWVSLLLAVFDWY